MKKVLVISGHTDLATSVANKTILDTIGQYLPETEIVKLDTLYPDFKIDVDAEQQRLLFEGGYPVLAKVAKRKGLPYPHVNVQGEIEADADWWATMQAAG